MNALTSQGTPIFGSTLERGVTSLSAFYPVKDDLDTESEEIIIANLISQNPHHRGFFLQEIHRRACGVSLQQAEVR